MSIAKDCSWDREPPLGRSLACELHQSLVGLFEMRPHGGFRTGWITLLQRSGHERVFGIRLVRHFAMKSKPKDV